MTEIITCKKCEKNSHGINATVAILVEKIEKTLIVHIVAKHTRLLRLADV
jgi:hypothetical protein